MQTGATGSSPGGGAPPPYIGWSPGPPPPDIDAKPRGPMERSDSMLERTDQLWPLGIRASSSFLLALTRDGEAERSRDIARKKIFFILDLVQTNIHTREKGVIVGRMPNACVWTGETSRCVSGALPLLDVPEQERVRAVVRTGRELPQV